MTEPDKATLEEGGLLGLSVLRAPGLAYAYQPQQLAVRHDYYLPSQTICGVGGSAEKQRESIIGETGPRSQVGLYLGKEWAG